MSKPQSNILAVDHFGILSVRRQRIVMVNSLSLDQLWLLACANDLGPMSRLMIQTARNHVARLSDDDIRKQIRVIDSLFDGNPDKRGPFRTSFERVTLDF